MIQGQIGALAPAAVLGLRQALPNSASWIDESSVMYVAGNMLAVANKEQSSVKFQPLTDRGDGIAAMAVSPDKRLLAVSEHSSKQLPFVCVYDLSTMRKRKSIGPAVAVNKAQAFTHMAFAENGKFFALVLGEPHFQLQFMNWEKAQVYAVAPCITDADTDAAAAQRVAQSEADLPSAALAVKIQEISISPFEPCLVCVLTNMTVKTMTYVNGEMECRVLPTGSFTDFTCHAWVSVSVVAVGTAAGQVLLLSVDGHEEMQVFDLSAHLGQFAAPEPAAASASEAPVAAGSTAAPAQVADGESAPLVSTIVRTPLGVLAAGAAPFLAYIQLVSDENRGDSHQAPPASGQAPRVHGAQPRLWAVPLADVTSNELVLSPSRETCLLVSRKQQLFSFSVASLEIDPSAAAASGVKVAPMTTSFHQGAIAASDVCCRKPLVVTLGTDHTLRIWNYLTGTQELVRSFADDLLSVAIHPSGLYLVLGLVDRFRFYTVTVDELRLAKEVNVRVCRVCRFSNGGQFFAVVNANVINVYNTWTFDQVCTLKAHNNKIRSLYWSADDQRLVSAGADGGLYLWNIPAGTRESEYVLKTCSFGTAATSLDGKTMWAIGSDGQFREICESTVTQELATEMPITQLAPSRSGDMLFAGTSAGHILSLRFPFTSSQHDFTQYFAHSAPVTSMRLSFDDRFLVTTAEDGCIFVFRIPERDMQANRRETVSLFSDEILVTRADLEEKIAHVSDLQRHLEELKMEQEYQFRLKDMAFNEKMKGVSEKYLRQIDELKQQPARVRREKDTEDLAHVEELKALKVQQLQEYQAKEGKYNNALMVEFEKYHVKEVQTAHDLDQFQERFAAMQTEQKALLAQLVTKHEGQIRQKDSQLQQQRELARTQCREYVEMRRQLEEDIDTEIRQAEAQCIKRLQAEHDELARLKGESGIMRKRFTTLNKEIEDSKAEVLQLSENCQRLQQQATVLEHSVVVLKEKVSEYDEVIQLKERKIYELKKSNQELDKYKFVLDYRIKDIKQQIEPREANIAEIAGNIQEMNEELEKVSNLKQDLEKQVDEHTERLAENKREYSREHQRLRRIIGYITKMKKEVSDAVVYIQDPPLLKKSMQQLQALYCSKVQQSDIALSPNVIDEVDRQHEQLHIAIGKLRRELQVQQSRQHADRLSALHQNEQLLAECKQLRSQLRFNANAPKLPKKAAVRSNGAPVSSGVAALASLPDQGTIGKAFEAKSASPIAL